MRGADLGYLPRIGRQKRMPIKTPRYHSSNYPSNTQCRISISRKIPYSRVRNRFNTTNITRGITTTYSKASRLLHRNLNQNPLSNSSKFNNPITMKKIISHVIGEVLNHFWKFREMLNFAHQGKYPSIFWRLILYSR